MFGRISIEFIAMGAIALGIILATAVPSAITIVAGTTLLLGSSAALAWHYWVSRG